MVQTDGVVGDQTKLLSGLVWQIDQSLLDFEKRVFERIVSYVDAMTYECACSRLTARFPSSLRRWCLGKLNPLRAGKHFELRGCSPVEDWSTHRPSAPYSVGSLKVYITLNQLVSLKIRNCVYFASPRLARKLAC